MISALLLSSCGAATAARSSSSQKTPSEVANEFAVAFYGGRFAEAVKFVTPSNRAAFTVVTDGLSPGSVREKNIGTGYEKISGSHAVVVLTGTICNSGNKRTLASSRSNKFCETNINRKDLIQAFSVYLSRSVRGDWFIGPGGA
jgi:hypothetical protein